MAPTLRSHAKRAKLAHVSNEARVSSKTGHILKLPPEVLALCAGYLMTDGRKNAMLACKYLHSSMWMEIYRSVWWPITVPGGCNIITPYYWKLCSKVLPRRSKSFAKRMIDCPILALNVQRLDISLKLCRHCLPKTKNHEAGNTSGLCPDCYLVLAAVQLFKSLKALRVRFNSKEVLSYLPNLPNLRTMQIKENEWNDSGDLEVQELLHLIRYPKLASLGLEGRLLSSDGLQALGSLPQTNAGCEESALDLNIKRLLLDDTMLSPQILRELLERIGSLETFVYTTVDELRRDNFSPRGQLSFALAPIQSSVQNLFLTMHSWQTSFRMQEALTTVSSFESLKIFLLDPTLVFGTDDPWPSLFEGTLLPESLEKLTLYTRNTDPSELKPQVEAHIEENITGNPHLERLTHICLTGGDEAFTYRRCQHDAKEGMKCYGNYDPVRGWSNKYWSHRWGQISTYFTGPLNSDQAERISRTMDPSHEQNTIAWALFEKYSFRPNPFNFPINYTAED